MEYRLDFQARDLLYFGDGIQAGGATLGRGAAWPLPSVVNSAIINAMHCGLEEDVAGIEHKHTHLTEKEIARNKNVRFSFGGTRTLGPFPVRNGEIYVPTPTDLQFSADGKAAYMSVVNLAGDSNLPCPLSRLVASAIPPSKTSGGSWIALGELNKYLAGEKDVKVNDNADFYVSEHRTGIAIDQDRQSVVKSQLYSAEYMRLLPGVAMRIYASYEASSYQGKNREDMMAKAKLKNVFGSIMLGGQSGVALQCEMECGAFPVPAVKPSLRIKWVLLAPAIFRAGWMPGFVDAVTGEVRLKQEVERGNMPREQWRLALRQAPDIQARLVAARIPKYTVASGWKVNGVASGQAKATRRLVPAGSIFYFECSDMKNAEMLARALHGRTHSDECGEQGFGFGVCGNWDKQNL